MVKDWDVWETPYFDFAWSKEQAIRNIKRILVDTNGGNPFSSDEELTRIAEDYYERRHLLRRVARGEES